MYEWICKENPEFEAEFPYKEFRTHCISGLSRNFSLMIDGEKTTGMVPFADMHNHVIPEEASSNWHYHQASNGYITTALKDIPNGAPVEFTYGDLGNQSLFLNYGFNLRDNPRNEVSIRVFFGLEDPLLKTKVELINYEWTEDKH